MGFLDSARIRSKYFSARFSLGATTVDYNVDSNHALFKSQSTMSANYSSTRGLDTGVRYNLRIKPDTNPIWVKFNSIDNDAIYIKGDELFEEFNVSVNNIYLAPADATTAQVDRITVNDTAANHANDYFKLYARDATSGIETVYGFWFNLDAGGTQPTDSEVDIWTAVAITTGQTTTNIADAIETAVDGIIGVFTSSNTANVLDITHSSAGTRRDIAKSSGNPDTVSVLTQGAGQATTVNILVR